MAQSYILIAEPEPRLASTFDALAREAKYNTVLVKDGVAAREALEKHGLPSLLITNLVLPKLDGFGLLTELRKLAPPAQVPAMVVSSSMQLRNTAVGLRSKLGIAEIAATGMVVTTLRSALRRALAIGPETRGALSMPPAAIGRSVPPPPHNPASLDPARLARIDSLKLTKDLPFDQGLQRLVEETARRFNVPIALLSLVFEKQQWFKAQVGLSGDLLAQRSTPIEQAFCRHVVDADTATPLIVPDARRHPLFAENALVQDGKIGSYAGAPLLTSDGMVLGTLCIIDTQPLAIGYDEVDQLMALARRVAGELELRASEGQPRLKRATKAAKSASDLAVLAPVLSLLESGAMLLDADRKIVYVNDVLARWVSVSATELVGTGRDSFVQRLASLSKNPEDTLRRLRVHQDGPYLARDELELSLPVRRVLRWLATPVRLPHGVAQLATYTDITAEADLRELEDTTFFVREDDIIEETPPVRGLDHHQSADLPLSPYPRS